MKHIKRINEEVGFRNISKIFKDKNSCEIYFHKDLDGLTSAISMKEFLKSYYQVKTEDCHTIQYGGLEYAIKNHKPGNIPILVDFAHSKPMFKIVVDHHDKQTGTDDIQSTYFKHSRSNAEIISGEISYSDMFTPQDIELIRTVDSANFLKFNINPEDIQNSIFKYNKEESAEKNRFMMGFVVNRLLLAYKNKRITCTSLDGNRTHNNRNVLECIVLDSNTSLHSIFNNIKHYIINAKVSDKKVILSTPDEIMDNLCEYVEKMKNYRYIEDPNNGEVNEFDPYNWRQKNLLASGGKVGTGIHYDEDYKIISQYGGGNLFKPGSYDRYVPFRNHADSNFLCMVWPMGLIQVSCNPFKEKKLKEINLGEIAKEVLSKYEVIFKKYYISLESVKREYETSQDWIQMQKAEGEDYQGVGFMFNDLKSFYGDCLYKKEEDKIVGVNINDDELKNTINIIYNELSEGQRRYLSGIKIPLWEIITRNSGGHPSITNISGLNFSKYNKPAMLRAYKTENYLDIIKMIARDFVDNLKSKIDISNQGKEVKYSKTDVKLSGIDTNESIKKFNEFRS